jgi:hypothetical protein
VTPAAVEAGQEVILSGASFASDPGANTVLFGAQQAVVTAATAAELRVVVPDALGDVSSVPVVVRTQGGSSQPVAVGILRNPRITVLEPDVALPGASITIRGEHLAGPVSVTIGAMTAEVTEATPESLRVVVPALALPEGQKAEVVVTAGPSAAKPVDLIIGRLPLILEVSPERGQEGDHVLIKGRGFDPVPADNTVTFGGIAALVLASSAEGLTVVAPAATGGASPEVLVVVTSGAGTSGNDAVFGMARPTTSTFQPRFYAAAVPEYPDEALAFVSTRLGPVLLLGGSGASTSTAVRADDAATALNRLVAAAGSRSIEIEFDDNPPSVGVTGEGSPILVATQEDAAAYAKPWIAGARAPRLSPRAVARHWAAVLQDYVGLFMYRQRPLGVLSLSPRGQVFKDIYAEANRRGAGGTGVATNIVSPPSDRMAAALRAVALVPSAGNPREAVAVEGRWSGTLADPDTGDYRFEVRFQPDGAGLSGSLTAWRGDIEARAPLRDISFRAGTLRFTVDLRGAALQFEGTLADTRIDGTARQQGRSPATFTLQYVE